MIGLVERSGDHSLHSHNQIIITMTSVKEIRKFFLAKLFFSLDQSVVPSNKQTLSSLESVY